MSDLCKCGHAEDHHFTPRLGGRCFRHECDCVVFETPTADRDDLAAIIEAHEMSMDYESYRGCACSPAPYPKAPAISQQDHAAHVAQMVLESDWLRGVRAKELRDAAKEIYNGAGDPEQAFYNYGLHPWLMDRADRVDAEDGEN